MSAYFLHQPSRAKLTLHPSISIPSTKTKSQQSTPRTSISTDSMKTPILSSQETTAPSENRKIAKSTNAKTLLRAVQKRWRDHHESVQGSYELYYGQGASTGRTLGNPFVEVKKV
ncbi:hypothetical protein Vi05172_g3434 [Venturia inaequalis]|nr:hypothetical protein Vi05172_g3434 [Venturia inaequalis]